MIIPWLLDKLTLVILLIPHQIRVRIFTFFVFIYARLSSRYDRVCKINLTIAFPDESEEWRDAMVKHSYRNLAVLLSDFLRLPLLTKQWVDKHVNVPDLELIRRLSIKEPDRGIIFVVGHLGSFELQGYILGLLGLPATVVGRVIRPPWFNVWWNRRREFSGNRVVDREGAFRKASQALKRGERVAFLFDQNVTRNHAIFVPWLGRKAATTRAVALLAHRTRARVFMSAIHETKTNCYDIKLYELDIEQWYSSSSTAETTLVKITHYLVREYEKLIRAHPRDWFWMHRRWKTTEFASDAENLYSR